MPCRHCQRNVVDYSRGLCKKCFQNVGLRNRYPAGGRGSRSPAWEHEPSAEELEILIAQQLPTMPGRRKGDE